MQEAGLALNASAADLIARPIGLHVLRPEQDNRAYSVLEAKFDRAPDESPDGWGLKCYP